MEYNPKSQIVLDPVVKKFLDALAAQDGPPLYTLSPDAARKLLNDAQAQPVDKLPADIEDREIPVGPKGTVNIRIVRPKGNKDTLPVIIYVHGGGWVLGNKETHDRLIREIVNGTNAALVFVDYSLAPESAYPTAHEEAYATAKWVSEHGKELNVDTSRMVIAGDSVGGLMATAVALMAIERDGPHFIFQVLAYPVTDANFDTPSYEKYAKGYWLEKASMEWFWDCYVPDKSMRSQPFVSPLRASLEQLKKMPPTLILVGENDVLRDEVEAYAHKLMQAAVPVAAVRYLGLMHDFLMLNGITKAPGVRAAVAQINDTLRMVFAKK